MLLENRWSWGRQLYWGVILFLLFFFASLFFYDVSLDFKGIANLVIASFALFIFFLSTRTFKLLSSKIHLDKPLQITGGLAVLAGLLMFIVGGSPAHIVAVFQSKTPVISTVVALAAAILEESVCRGLFLSGFVGLGAYKSSHYQLTKASVYSALLFGGLHLFNLLGANPSAVFLQICYTFALGVFLAALRITSNGLFLPILLHFLLDWVPLDAPRQAGSSNWGMTLLVFLPLLLLSVTYLILLDQSLQKNSAGA
ncbi:abortive infection protein [Ligilactobacillus salitolerans]|uniref:Abortive infection protein n=1 Tax=Ligilactobacillus salitolerans TaxID=1808352 RepID=A0A401IS73_9LACO|nr:CPBP family intramembrane glutamic endopeptidase [Ligilactobacillus salitolerans]GBG94381.1 abortive infection protein [Ligilactobacillus salitolerans]